MTPIILPLNIRFIAFRFKRLCCSFTIKPVEMAAIFVISTSTVGVRSGSLHAGLSFLGSWLRATSAA
jgi:hypothetical protein